MCIQIWHYSLICEAYTLTCLSKPMYSTHSLSAMTAGCFLFFSLLFPWTLRIKEEKSKVLLWRNIKVTVWRCLAKRDLSLQVEGRDGMPCYFAFPNCSVAQACSMWTGLLKCVIAFCDHCMGGLLLDFTQQIWIMVKRAANWWGYANMSQMGTWGADDGDTLTLYGRASVWQVHHSVIKGHIITYNKACMTIAGINAVPLRVANCVLQFLFAFSLFCFVFLILANLLSAADAVNLSAV